MPRTRFDPTIRLLARRWREAGLLLPAFGLLARGRPLTVAELARASGASEDRVSRALAAARAERDAEGRYVDLYGLTLSPTLHRLEIAGRALFSCCALWAHVVPRLVSATVQVESVDPVRREVVRLSIAPEGVRSVQPAASAATLAVAAHDAIEADVCQAFCCQVKHFVDRDSALEFAAAHPSRHVVTVAELQGAADRLHQAILEAARP